MSILDKRTLTIASSGTTSNAIDVRDNAIVGLIMPAAMTGATLTVQFSIDNSTFSTVYDTAGNALTITVTASAYIGLFLSDFVGAGWVKFVSASAEAAERTITAVLRGA